MGVAMVWVQAITNRQEEKEVTTAGNGREKKIRVRVRN